MIFCVFLMREREGISSNAPNRRSNERVPHSLVRLSIESAQKHREKKQKQQHRLFELQRTLHGIKR